MKNYPAKLKYLTMLSMALLYTANSYAEKIEVGRNAAVKGTVEIQSADEEAARQALIKEPVFLNDSVNSRAGSSLQVLLKDNSTFTVGPQCDIVIDEFVYDPKKNSNSLSARVKKGMFRFTSGKVSRSNPDQINIETPTATMGIRGTMVEVLVGPEAFICAEKEGLLADDIKMDHAGATLVILRGPGANARGNNRRGRVDISSGGKTVVLSQSGTGVLVSNADQKPSEPFIVSPTLFGYFSRRLRTVPTGIGNFNPFEIDDNWFTPIKRYDVDGRYLTPFDEVSESDWPSSLDENDFVEEFDEVFEEEIENDVLTDMTVDGPADMMDSMQSDMMNDSNMGVTDELPTDSLVVSGG